MSDKPEGYPETIELDKMIAVSDQSNRIGNFIDWLYHEKGCFICEEAYVKEAYPHEQLLPINQGFESLLAEYFNIDLEQCEKERAAVLQFVRDQQEDIPEVQIHMAVDGEKV